MDKVGQEETGVANRNKIFWLGLPLTFMCTSGLIAQVQSQTDLQPFGKWQSDYGLEECRIIRSFGDPANPTAFQMAKFDPDSSVDPSISIFSNYFHKTPNNVRVKIYANGQNGREFVDGIIVPSASGTANVLYIQDGAAFKKLINADIAAHRQTIAHFDSGKTHLGFALGSMAGPVKALDTCTDDLLRSWGLDPEQQHSLQRKPEPITPPDTWFSSQDYPLYLSENGKTGGVFARLNISDTGEITQCHVMLAGGDEAFKDITCNVARKRGRFKPAISKEGKAVASYARVRVLWRSP